jgi:hypothetical protein
MVGNKYRVFLLTLLSSFTVSVVPHGQAWRLGADKTSLRHPLYPSIEIWDTSQSLPSTSLFPDGRHAWCTGRRS